MAKLHWVLGGVIVLLLLSNFILYQQAVRVEQSPELEDTVAELSSELAEAQEQNRALAAQLNYYRNLTDFYMEEVQRLQAYAVNLTEQLPEVQEGGITAVAVASLRDPSTGRTRLEGVTMTLNVQVMKGSGRVLVSTEPLTGADFQSAARTAVVVAQRETGMDFSGLDVVFSVKAPFPVAEVDGPSAGGAMSVLLISLVDGRPLKSDIMMTGSIMQDGSIGEVGGVLEKAEAAGRAGAAVFLVPEGQSQVVVYEEKQIRRGPFIFIITEPKLVNLSRMMSERYGMRVVEVEGIQEALQFYLT